MAGLRDLVLQLNSHPEPTPTWAIEAAIRIAQRFEARLSAGLCEVEIPDVSHWLGHILFDAKEVIATENRKSRDAAQNLTSRLRDLLPTKLLGEEIIVKCQALVTHWRLAERIRSHDLIIVPVYGHEETRSLAEGLVFDAGRPILMLPPAGGAGHAFDHVVIGWDNSRSAARALADALPFCTGAKSVTVVRVIGEKDLDDSADPAQVVRHLAAHGIAASSQDVSAGDVDAGQALLNHCRHNECDLLVIGAYGHTRAREFILGGATRSVLAEIDLPVLLSH